MFLAITRSRLALEPILLLMDTGAPFLEGKAAGQQGWPHIPFSTEHKEAQTFSLLPFASVRCGVYVQNHIFALATYKRLLFNPYRTNVENRVSS